jgi:hypothetical protein
MKLFKLTIAGFLIQALGLIAFILVSRTSVAAIGKPAVIALFTLALMLVLWFSFKWISTRSSLIYLPALLAFGYVVAFHVVGMVAFHGLLSDWDFSLGYLLLLLRMAAIMFVLYAIAAGFLFLLKKARARGDVLQS